MAIFGAQGIRDAMCNSYQKHVRKFQNQPLPEGTTLHQVGLYGSLSARYIVGFKQKSEVEVWLELTPFMRLDPDEGLAALAEYVVYKEMPAKADTGKLTEQLQKGLSLLTAEERESLVPMARLNGFAWTHLV